MRKLLWVGDAVVSTGFARCTHYTLDVLRDDWEVYVLGLNYNGDPHTLPYPVFPCWSGGDAFGVGRIRHMVDTHKPDIVIIQNDPWNIPEYVKQLRAGTPIVATMPVDGKNCRGTNLNGLSLAIFWTRFGEREARAGGWIGRSCVVPLGVDLDIYKPMDKAVARRRMMNVPPELDDIFLVGNVNRNQPRKRLDLTIRYFAEWVKAYNRDDAYLYLHVAPTGDHSYDIVQMMQYYGFSGSNKRLLATQPVIGVGVREEDLAATYACFDVQLSTTQGEGWGLTTMEGMACGIPQIVPDWSALGEWTEDAVYKIPCTSTAVHPNRVNVIGGVPDEAETVSALEELYQDAKLRASLREKGLALVARPEYRWEAVGKAFADALDALLPEKHG